MIKTDFFSRRKFLVGGIFFKKLNSSLTKELKLRDNYQVSVTLVSDRQMRELNKKWRQKNKPTDVLSWPFKEGKQLSIELEFQVLGEIVMDYQQAERQAKEHKHSLRLEIARLYIHGFLHLLGFDHDTVLKASKMKSLEENILKRAGFKL